MRLPDVTLCRHLCVYICTCAGFCVCAGMFVSVCVYMSGICASVCVHVHGMCVPLSGWDVWDFCLCVREDACEYLFSPPSLFLVLSSLSPKDLWKIPERRWWLGRRTSDMGLFALRVALEPEGQHFPGSKSLSWEESINLLVRGKMAICPCLEGLRGRAGSESLPSPWPSLEQGRGK